MLRHSFLRAVVGLSVLFFGVASQAAPFSFLYTNHINVSLPVHGAMIPGVNVGDTFTLNVIVDNGGSTLLNQTWLITDVVSATATVGTYSASYLAPNGSSDGMGGFPYAYPYAFQTNSDGLIASVRFYDIGPNNTDSFGTGGHIGLYTNGILDVDGNFSGWEVDGNGQSQRLFTDLFSEWLWSNSLGSIVAPPPPNLIPEPAISALFALGIVGIGISRRTQKPARRLGS